MGTSSPLLIDVDDSPSVTPYEVWVDVSYFDEPRDEDSDGAESDVSSDNALDLEWNASQELCVFHSDLFF